MCIIILLLILFTKRPYKVYSVVVLLKRAAGIEPALIAWKAIVLPLNYARMSGSMPPTLLSQLQEIDIMYILNTYV